MAKVREGFEGPSQDGLIKDVERRILTMCEDGFQTDDVLKHLDSKPTVFEDINPNEVELSDLPALYCWCSGFGVDLPQAGGLGRKNNNRKVTRNFEFYCNVQYMCRMHETKEHSDTMKTMGWHLFNLISSNMDLDGLVIGDPQLLEVDLFPRWRLVGDKLQNVSNVNIKIVYPYQDRSSISKR